MSKITITGEKPDISKPRFAIKRGKRTIGLGRYAGKWVALDKDDKVIDSADSLKELAEMIDKMEPEEKPAYFLVPRDDEGPYYILPSFQYPWPR